ncbi:MAG TPA: zf-HC2 domain-containing protein [Acidimicrobiia bacterium]|nr:zf-HC2 domain-containing protein [Acidimicrobiia bacterium]
MTCTHIRHAISARLDGEDPGIDDAVVDTHVATCAACRGFVASATRLHRATRLGAAPDVPDLTPAILAAIGDAGQSPAPAPPDSAVPETQLALRWVLATIAIVQIAVAVPALVFGSDAGLPVHTARHLGSFELAIAVGFLFAAWRPSRIPGLFPVVAALVACLAASSLLDVIAGNTAALSEAQHATDFAGLVVLWLLSRTLPSWTRATPRTELA